NSLAGLANAIEPGGILIYTGQPWHPQLEMIAGVLTSHKDGKPWVMRVRSQGEMDSLVRDAGFDKCTQRIDEWGIFTVSMAVRRVKFSSERIFTCRWLVLVACPVFLLHLWIS